MRKKEVNATEKQYLIEKISAFLKEKEYIIFAYIFGSFALEERFSDIDIGIFVSGKKNDAPLASELELEKELEDILRFPVDSRIINYAPLSFVYNVLKTGILIVDNDKSRRADFESIIYRKYFDYRHLRDEYLREISHAAV